MECLVAVLVAAPLGISFSRRGVLGGVAGAILALIGLVFLNQLFVSLGKGMKVSAWLTVWMPHLIIGAIGLTLLVFRSRNRDLPSLSWLIRFFNSARRAVPLRKRAA
jgi:lipopolysaccharide export LptBFGC system permease protein LptF